MPRRTLYLMSVRTGPSTSDFGRLFDRADPGSIVDDAAQSIVAPQALFFLNDPFVSDLARDLAARVARRGAGEQGMPHPPAVRPRLGRPPTPAEIDSGPADCCAGRGGRSLGALLPPDPVYE